MSAPETLESLCTEYENFCHNHGLKKFSADELILEDITKEQREWLQDFLRRWKRVVHDNE